MFGHLGTLTQRVPATVDRFIRKYDGVAELDFP